MDSQGDTGKAQLSIGAKVSTSLVDKLYADTYEHHLKEAVRERICAYYNVSEDDLFPPATNRRGKAAS